MPISAWWLVVCLGALGGAEEAADTRRTEQTESAATLADPEVYESQVVAKRVHALKITTDEFPGQVDIVIPDADSPEDDRTFTQAMERVPGVSLIDEQGNTAQMDLTLRGEVVSSVTGLAQGISVYIDGVRVNEIDGEEVNFDLLPLNDVERIEIIRGPHPIFGRNTLGGSINFVTKHGQGPAHSGLEVGLGMYLDQKLQLRTSGAVGKFGYYSGIGLEGTQGWRDGSHEQQVHAFGRLNYAFTKATKVSFTGQFNNNKVFQPGSLPANVLAERRRANLSPGDYYQPDLYMGTLQLEHVILPEVTWVVRAFVRQNTVDDFNANALDTDTALLSDMTYTGLATQLISVWDIGAMRNNLVVGVEGSFGNVDLTTSSIQNSYSLSQCPSVDDCPLVALEDRLGDEQAMAAAYLQESLRIPLSLSSKTDSLNVFLSGRFDFNSHHVVDTSPGTPGAASGDISYKKFMPSAGVRWDTDVVDVYARFSQSFRAPSFLELVCASSDAPCVGLEAGVAPDTSFTALQPVTANNYELGVQADLPADIEAHAAIYQSDLDNDIFSVAPNGTSNLYFANVGKTRRCGVEASATWKSASLDLHIDYAYTLATFQSELQTLETPRTGDDENIVPDDQLTMIPNHRMGAAVTYRVLEGLSATANVTYVGSQYLRGDEENTQQKLQGYTRIDLGAAYRRGGFSGSLQIRNLLDSDYSTFATYAPNPTKDGTPIERFYTPAAPITLYASAGYDF